MHLNWRYLPVAYFPRLLVTLIA
ncbi:hypothetical protein JMJ77_0002158 [Colletotrichum scovillei]|uniref:Uncharacterized protein n=1 Tax=Colletotrichum scovillei TaxID=1209932 RepID=A0A9P7RAS1_9PEZI|nr:hypothetical protein JMJ77_0002158 [Colletotrichum scovillei]KAG7070575.1 hypothetical protein JMJ76_0001823 [Colletotrichum scovillei]KAG7078825.1 hypothetical protein JMJ78_0002489 [Colletotrichum scovillei]